LRRVAVIGLLCVALPAGARAQTDPEALQGSRTACDGSYCVVGGTTTVSFTNDWLRRAEARGIRFGVQAPASRRGNRFAFPIARVAGQQDGYERVGLSNQWVFEDCELARGGLSHRGNAVIAVAGSRRAVRVFVDGSQVILEVPEPGSWPTGQRPKPFSLVLDFASWKVLSLKPGGFTAEARLRVSSLTKGLSVPAGVAGSVMLNVRLSPRIANLATCSRAPATSWPSPNEGTLYPLLAGSVAYRTPLENLYAKLGRGGNCNLLGCSWESSTNADSFGPSVVAPVDGRTGVQLLLDGVQLSTENASRSRLRGWRSPEGIHIGSPIADLRRAYPDQRIGCIPGACAMGFLTRPYPVASSGRETRQRFDVVFRYRQGGSSVEVVDVRLHGEEGTCGVNWRHEGTFAEFEARCFGPLVSARLEPVGATPRFDAGGNDPGGVIRSAVDAAGTERYVLASPLVTGGTAPARLDWTVECRPSVVDDCAPGRGAGEETWPAGSFEEWGLTFSGYSARPAPPRAPGPGPAIPPMRFTAQFLDRPAFSIVISRGY
jgi:hypothetical protein